MIPVGTNVAVTDGDLLGSVGVVVSRDPDNRLALVRVARDAGRHSYDEVNDRDLLLSAPPCTPDDAAQAHTGSGSSFHDR